MRIVVLATAALVLTGCQTAEQRRAESEQAYAQFERIDEFMCTSLHGTTSGTVCTLSELRSEARDRGLCSVPRQLVPAIARLDRAA